MCALVSESLSINSHLQFFVWLQVGVREFLPHDLLIAAWGDFDAGELEFDISSALPGVRTGQWSQRPDLVPMLQFSHKQWLHLGRKPFTIRHSPDKDIPAHFPTCRSMRMETATSLTVHGIPDRRGKSDCLYIFADYQNAHRPQTHMTCNLLLPHIDAALRRIDTLPKSEACADGNGNASPCVEFALSDREEEIMEWVCIGKTNPEIGTILGISANTVKNHLKRIFDKMGVTNRAQAVAKLNPYLMPGG